MADTTRLADIAAALDQQRRVSVRPALIRLLGLRDAVVLQQLRWHCDTFGAADVTANILADETGVTVDQARKALTSLATQDLIRGDEVEPMSRRRRYVLTRDLTGSTAPTGALVSADGRSPDCADGRTLPIEDLDPVVKETDMAADAAAIDDRITMAWSTFWDRYPKSRRIGKAKCEAIYRKAIRAMNLAPGDVNPINSGLTLWLRYWSGVESERFVPHAATWLNQRRWETDPTVADDRPTAARSFRDQRARIMTDRDGPEGVIKL